MAQAGVTQVSWAFLVAGILSSPPAVAGPAGPNCLPKDTEADVPISDLHPTQPNVGLGEVLRKKKGLANVDPQVGSTDDGEAVPVVVGPDGRLYVSDHHHFVAALDLAKGPSAKVHVRVIDSQCGACDASLPACTRSFWTHMVSEHLTYLCNTNDTPIPHTALPETFDLPTQASPAQGTGAALADDPYRTLVNVMRKQPSPQDGKPCLVRPTDGTSFFWEFRMAEKIRRQISTQDAALVAALSPTAKPPQTLIDAACGAFLKDNSDASCASTIAKQPDLVVGNAP